MKSLALIGKKYVDTILNVGALSLNETNNCSLIDRRNGGIYNFFDIKDYKLKIETFEFGIKEAFIINESDTSSRTSIVKTAEPSDVSSGGVQSINTHFDWCHICYLDDLEQYDNLIQLDVPFSIDFCTNNNRKQFVQLMKKSQIIFDSRERKNLYHNYDLKTPILLHDEKGIEIIINGEVVYGEKLEPISNLNVNGAGDMFAGFFIQNYFEKNLKDSAYCAMLDTTKALLQRNNNEEV